MHRLLGAPLMILAVAVVVAAPGRAGNAKAPAWKPFLPADAYQELARRAVNRIRGLAKEDDADGLRGEAIILAAYTISTKDPAGSASLRQQAIKIATLAAAKDTAAEACKLATGLTLLKGGTKKNAVAIDWPAAIGSLGPVMKPLASKAKGGEGIAVDLQYTVKLKSQNSPEALLAAMATKKLSAANAGKVAKELELLGYRMATIGALTRRRGPTKNKDDAPQWDEQALLMRDSAVDLADAARKKDVTAILAASKRLVGSCVECHANFK